MCALRTTSWILRSLLRSDKFSVQKISRVQKRFFAEEGKVTKGLVIGVYEAASEKEPKLTPGGEKFDDRNQGKISELIKESHITGALGKGKIFNDVDQEYRSVAVVGLGREGAAYNEDEEIDEGMENVRVAAGVGARALQMQGCTEVFVDSMEYPEQAAEGSALAIWRYNDNLMKKNRVQIPKLELYDSAEVDAWTRGLFKAEAQNLARRLSDAPANQMTPTAFAQATVDALCPCGVTVEIRTMEWIEQQHLNSFLMVAKGSCEPPILLEVNYCGTSPEEKPVLFLGKGMTFNSGGLCLRECPGMDEYRGAMAGAATVVSAIRAAAALSLPINVTGIIPLCENMPSGMAVKPGDVVGLLNGKNLLVRNTSKAGVVLMADPLIYAQNTFKPKLIVDIATLSNGVVKGLGGGATGFFSNSHYVWKQFRKAGGLTGDRMWRLPLWRYYKEIVTRAPSADITNDGLGPASACLAAAVLHEVVPCADWAHLDIRGVGMISRVNTLPYLLKDRMTGRPTRTLIQFLYQMSCPDSNKN